MERYECDKCGACCKHLIIEIDTLDLIREPRLIPVTSPFRIPPGMELQDEDGNPAEPKIPSHPCGGMLACGSTRPCPMLGADNLCAIHPTRPNVCVAFRAGSEQCQDARRMAGLEPLKPTES